MIEDVRKGTNEDEFRHLNEQLEERARTKSGREGRFEIVCECNREECTSRITISFPDYEAVRATPTAFIVLPGHADLTCERITSSTDTYDVVEKFRRSRTRRGDHRSTRRRGSTQLTCEQKLHRWIRRW